MKFMMIVNATKDTEAGVMPSEKMIAAMTAYNQELLNAGALVDLSGLQPSSTGTRIQYSGNERIVLDGPFAETKQLIAGYWLIQAKSKEEAIDWAKRAPNPYGDGAEGYIEVRQLFEIEDFAPSDAVEDARKLGNQLGRKK